MPELKIAFWNLKNLFDTEKATRDRDLRNEINDELVRNMHELHVPRFQCPVN